MSDEEPLWVQALSTQVKAEARATAAEAREAKLREALDRLIAYYDPLGHLWGNGCHHGFKPASRCENEGCEERELHRALQALETHTRARATP